VKQAGPLQPRRDLTGCHVRDTLHPFRRRREVREFRTGLEWFREPKVWVRGGLYLQIPGGESRSYPR